MRTLHVMLSAFVLIFSGNVYASAAEVPVASDSRVKTFVYSENDVFNLVMRYGYQTIIQLDKKETIETISMGDRVGWQITSRDHRIFIRPMQENVHTNMTVITNKRTYLFDLVATDSLSKNGEELAYIIRFFYPDDKQNRVGRYDAPVPEVRADPQPLSLSASSVDVDGKNYNYTFSGSEQAAPLKIFDDGASTYFKLNSAASSPKIYVIDVNGAEREVAYSQQGDYAVVSKVAGKFVLRQGDVSVQVFNENQSIN